MFPLTFTASIFLPFLLCRIQRLFLPFVASIQGWDPGGLLPMQFAKLAPAILQLLLLKGVALHIYATYVYIRVLKMGNYQIMLTHFFLSIFITVFNDNILYIIEH